MIIMSCLLNTLNQELDNTSPSSATDAPYPLNLLAQSDQLLALLEQLLLDQKFSLASQLLQESALQSASLAAIHGVYNRVLAHFLSSGQHDAVSCFLSDLDYRSPQIDSRNLFEHCAAHGLYRSMKYCHRALDTFTSDPSLLLRSVRAGNVKQARYLFEHGLTYSGDPLLKAAIKAHSLQCLHFLRYSMQVAELSDPHVFEVALHTASESFDLSVLEFLLQELTFAFDPREILPLGPGRYSLYKAFVRAVKHDFKELLEFAHFRLKLRFAPYEYESDWDKYSKLLVHAVTTHNADMLEFLIEVLRISPAVLAEQTDSNLNEVIEKSVPRGWIMRRMLAIARKQMHVIGNYNVQRCPSSLVVKVDLHELMRAMKRSQRDRKVQLEIRLNKL